MRPGELIEETLAMYRALGADGLHVSSDLNAVVARLLDGAADIPLELPWEEVYEGVRIERHQVVLTRMDGAAGRIYFYNPAASPERAAGAELGGPMGGPERRCEGPRQESMAFEAFARFFAEGHAYALLRHPPKFTPG